MIIVENLNKIVLHEDKKFVYYYRIIKRALSLYSGDACSVQSYGIEIERQDIVNGNVVNFERDRVLDISPDRYKVHLLLKLLYDNGVSPVHLIDVAGEYIDDYITDFDNYLEETAMN